MIVTLVTIYLIGFAAMAGFVLVMSAIGSLFDSMSVKNYLWAIAAGLVWPALVIWSGVAFVKYKIKG